MTPPLSMLAEARAGNPSADVESRYVRYMDDVTLQELRDNGEAVLDRVQAGESLTVTRAGRPVAELRPLPSRESDPAGLLDRWRNLPRLDPDDLRRDVDQVIDPLL